MRNTIATGGVSSAEFGERFQALNRPVTSGSKLWPVNVANNQAEILVYQEIGFWFGAAQFIDQLNQLANVDVIDVRINSIGGIASEAIAMYHALVRNPAQIRVWIDAAAYSAASVLAMAASPGELRMAFNARIMMHNAWNVVAGDHRDMQKEAAVLELLDGTIAATYGKRMTNSKDEILALMNDETWYDAEGAVAAGLVDETFDAEELPADAGNIARRVELAAHLGLTFKHMPQGLLGREPELDRVAATAVEVDARWCEIQERRCEIQERRAA
jgi:ATP-dependent protease ClpP protease subunit